MTNTTQIKKTSLQLAEAFLVAAAISVPATAAQTLSITIPDASTEKGALIIRNNHDKEILSFTPSAYAQVQYINASADGSGKNRNGFALRRTSITLAAKIDQHWDGRVSFEFDSKTSGGIADTGYIECAYVGYTNDFGSLKVGILKPHFLQEEITAAIALPAIERSIATNYLSSPSAEGPRGLSAAHIGIYWDGNFAIDSIAKIHYGTSLTNAVGQDYDARSNDLQITVYAESEFDFGKSGKLTTGLSGVANYGDDGALPGTRAGTASALTNAGTVFGIEPYLRYSNGGLNILLDSYYVNGDDASKISDTFAAIGIVSYRTEFNLEPVFRVARLAAKTKNAGVHSGYQSYVPASDEHSNAVTYYLGVNYYANKHVKLSAGYEYGRYFGTGDSDSSSAFRTQAQVAF